MLRRSRFADSAASDCGVPDLLQLGMFSPDIHDFLDAVVRGRKNLLISGGTGSGKSTLLGALAEAIPDRERIVTIEDSAELILDQEHVVRMETRPPNIEGRGLITARDLVINALRMRPDRIIVGEVRSGEALDMLQAMNTGHDGGVTTVHANSPRDAFARLETMVLMAGLDLPSRAIREQIVSALHLIVHVRRFEDGVRRVERSRDVGMEGTTPQLQDIFRFERRGQKGKSASASSSPRASSRDWSKSSASGNRDSDVDVPEAAEGDRWAVNWSSQQECCSSAQ